MTSKFSEHWSNPFCRIWHIVSTINFLNYTNNGNKTIGNAYFYILYKI